MASASAKEKAQVSVLTRNGAAARVPVAQRRRLRSLLRRALLFAGRSDAAVCLSLSDDAELRSLNARFADEDHATDVLSFAQPPPPSRPPAPPLVPVPLGDIIISVETAERQAQQHGHGLDAELFHLAVHGLCHLFGYDHATLADERVMFAYEARLRTAARSGRPVHSLEGSSEPS